MKNRDVSHVRARSGARFELTTRSSAGEARGGPRLLSAAETVEAIRALPQSHEIRFTSDSSGSVSILALVNAALQRRPGRRVVREAPGPRSYMRLSQRRDGLYDVEVEPADGSPGHGAAGLSAEAVVSRYLAVGRYKFTCRDPRGRLAIEQPPADIARALEARGRRYGREASCERCRDAGQTADGQPCAWCAVAMEPGARRPAPGAAVAASP